MAAPAAETVETVLRHADAAFDQSRENLFDLLRIPSISAQPAHQHGLPAGGGVVARPAHRPRLPRRHPADRRAIRWWSGTTTGPPDYKGPHVLFYGHYDVQPVDPLELWNSPPFEPQLVDGPRGKRFVARGAVDDKGQTVMFLEALRAWHTAGGGIPARITVLIEGEEEVGSVNLEPFLAANKAELASDIALISDTGMWDIDTPAITTRLRGMTYAEVTLKAANRDLHSGLFGGSALNPINALTRILGELQDAERPHPVAGLLRPGEAGHQRAARAMGCAGVRRGGVPRRHRPVGAGRRARLCGAGAAVGAADRRHQRHLGRLYRRGQPRP